MTKGRLQNSFVPLMAKGKFLTPKPPNFFFLLRSQKWSKIPKKNFLAKKCQEAHQIDQRNVLNTKMYVLGAMGHKW